MWKCTHHLKVVFLVVCPLYSWTELVWSSLAKPFSRFMYLLLATKRSTFHFSQLDQHLISAIFLNSYLSMRHVVYSWIIGQFTLCNYHHRFISFDCVSTIVSMSSRSLGALLLQICSIWSILEPSIASLLVTSSCRTSVERSFCLQDDSSLSCHHAGLWYPWQTHK